MSGHVVTIRKDSDCDTDAEGKKDRAPLASPSGRGAQCAHWAERERALRRTLCPLSRFAPAPPEGGSKGDRGAVEGFILNVECRM